MYLRDRFFPLVSVRGQGGARALSRCALGAKMPLWPVLRLGNPRASVYLFRYRQIHTTTASTTTRSNPYLGRSH
jgi:hypothetical protein